MIKILKNKYSFIKKIPVNRKGFTLIEVLVSLAIFVIFTSIIINSYSSIIASQKKANEYRALYAEARQVFETLVSEFREGVVDYGSYKGTVNSALDDIWLVSKDAEVKTRFFLEEEDVNGEPVSFLKMGKGEVNEFSPDTLPTFDQARKLNSSRFNIKEISFLATPAIDPYDDYYVNYDSNQFHPKVTIYMVMETNVEGVEDFEIELQTTVSSRVYHQVYPVNHFE